MWTIPATERWMGRALLLVLVWQGALIAPAQSAPLEAGKIKVVAFEGTVEFAQRETQDWRSAGIGLDLKPGDRVRTGERSWVTLLWSDQSAIRFGELTDFTIEPPAPRMPRPGLRLISGLLYFFHRDQPAQFGVTSRTTSAAIRGTEFTFAVDASGRTVLTVLDGEVELSNPSGTVFIRSHEQGVSEEGQPPRKSPVLAMVNAIQWCLYYPGVLDPDELNLSTNNQAALAESLAAYRTGDLRRALEAYPTGHQPRTEAESVYRAALLLAAGEVEQALALLEMPSRNSPDLDRFGRLAVALRKLIAAVKQQTVEPAPYPLALGTEWLAESYYQQSRARLPEALAAARQAVAISTNFGFAWTRLAELEFSFAQTKAARHALEKGLDLSPRNAQAVALSGFLVSAENRIKEAQERFDRAIALDPGLANAWLGRGLCRIRRGNVENGREDLLLAASLEPQRAVLRSYLAKAYSLTGQKKAAEKEIVLAKELDPNDPTTWLYSALLNQRYSRINPAVHELEKSQALNENRAIYRSRLLLDQDRAVRGVNLANVYDDAGLDQVSLWEAARAVNADYANFSGHLFLANSYQRLRDPHGVNQRFETPAVNEYLLASLLAPVGAGTLAQSVSEQEYSKLFERNGLGFAGSVEYLSRGAWTASGAQYGTIDNTSYALSGFHYSDPGQQPNGDIDQTELSVQIQQQITPDDSVYLRALREEVEGGDLAQYYDPTAPSAQGGPNRDVRTKETQEPIVLGGYHHQWSPANHTLLLVGGLQDTLRVTNPDQPMLLFAKDNQGTVQGVFEPFTIQQKYRSEAEIGLAEAQHIWQQSGHRVVAGARYQWGDFRTENQHSNPSFPLPFLFPDEPQSVRSDFERISGYGYYSWQVLAPLQLTAGLSYDQIRFPADFRFAPLVDDQETKSAISPKGGLIWTPLSRTTLRAAYSQSLGGASIDQSFRLEPTQVAGFNQTFRSLIPESVVGANAGANFETIAASLEQKLGSGTYLGAGGERLSSEVDRLLGVYDFAGFTVTPSTTPQEIDFHEDSLLLNLNQLVGEGGALGVRYRLSDAELTSRFEQVPDTAILGEGFRARQELESVLHQVTLFGIYNHPSGIFGEAQALWNQQSNRGHSPDRPDQDFWQFNLFLGYRFFDRRAQARVGLLNLTDQDYRLDPLNLTLELPRERTLLVQLTFNF